MNAADRDEAHSCRRICPCSLRLAADFASWNISMRSSSRRECYVDHPRAQAGPAPVSRSRTSGWASSHAFQLCSEE